MHSLPTSHNLSQGCSSKPIEKDEEVRTKKQEQKENGAGEGDEFTLQVYTQPVVVDLANQTYHHKYFSKNIIILMQKYALHHCIQSTYQQVRHSTCGTNDCMVNSISKPQLEAVVPRKSSTPR